MKDRSILLSLKLELQEQLVFGHTCKLLDIVEESCTCTHTCKLHVNIGSITAHRGKTLTLH